ncbi:GNAT family N-acetyltransferase [Paenibacillus alkalitolerans]|uniref:GNAT family N-acetyltransferase n=1 Tax=Paenibacillus alkalitolerans TaxID=2799335 RepID=UPI0018F754E7|nr:GNAT family N-acetyltransferase [Paenibacillus alkalitolerans]
MNIRKANIDDVEGVAHVHVNSWRSTYKGLISDTFLSNLTLEGRKKNWLWTFNNLNQDEEIFVAMDQQGIIGFSNSGKNRNHEYDHDGELYAIYLLKEYQGKGIGRRLVQAAVDSLKVKGYKSMMLWVLENNPSLGFYLKIGGTVIGKKDITIGGDTLIELAVAWGNLDDIV